MRRPGDLRLEALAARQLVAELQAADEALSEEDALCAVESETDLVEVATTMVAALDQDDEHLLIIAAMIKRLQDRAARIDLRLQRRRDALLAALELTGMRTLQTALGTITRVEGRPAPRIVDEAEIPESFWRVTRKPDMRAIAAALKAGPVPGVENSNGSPSLAIRRK